MKQDETHADIRGNSTGEDSRSSDDHRASDARTSIASADAAGVANTNAAHASIASTDAANTAHTSAGSADPYANQHAVARATAQLIRDIEAYEPLNEQEAADKQVILRALRTDPGCFERSAQAHMACSIWMVDPTLTQTLLVYHNIYDSWSWIGGHADGERDLAAVALRELQEETGVEHARLMAIAEDGALVPWEQAAEPRASQLEQSTQNEGEVQTDCDERNESTEQQDRNSQGGSATQAGSPAGIPAVADNLSDPRSSRAVRTPVYSLEVLTVDGHEKHEAYVSSHLHLNVTYLAIADPAEHTRIKPDENSGVQWVPLEDAIRLSTEPWIRNRIYRKLIDKLKTVRA